MLQQLIDIVEISTTGVAATIAAFQLGVYRVDLLMAVYFAVALAVQMMLVTLAPVSRIPRPGPRE